MNAERIADAVTALGRALDDLQSADLSTLEAGQLGQLLAELETVSRRAAGVGYRLVAEAEGRRLAGDYGRCGTADLLVELLRITPAEAKRPACPGG